MNDNNLLSENQLGLIFQHNLHLWIFQLIKQMDMGKYEKVANHRLIYAFQA